MGGGNPLCPAYSRPYAPPAFPQRSPQQFLGLNFHWKLPQYSLPQGLGLGDRFDRRSHGVTMSTTAAGVTLTQRPLKQAVLQRVQRGQPFETVLQRQIDSKVPEQLENLGRRRRERERRMEEDRNFQGQQEQKGAQMNMQHNLQAAHHMQPAQPMEPGTEDGHRVKDGENTGQQRTGDDVGGVSQKEVGKLYLRSKGGLAFGSG
jgi:hypothetical protein